MEVFVDNGKADQLILDFMLADIQDPRPEIELLKARAREYLNGRLESAEVEGEDQGATSKAEE